MQNGADSDLRADGTIDARIPVLGAFSSARDIDAARALRTTRLARQFGDMTGKIEFAAAAMAGAGVAEKTTRGREIGKSLRGRRACRAVHEFEFNTHFGQLRIDIAQWRSPGGIELELFPVVRRRAACRAAQVPPPAGLDSGGGASAAGVPSTGRSPRRSRRSDWRSLRAISFCRLAWRKLTFAMPITYQRPPPPPPPPPP